MALIKLNKDGPLATMIIERSEDGKVLSASPDNMVHLIPGWNEVPDDVWEKIKIDLADRMKAPDGGVAQIEINTMQQRIEGEGGKQTTIVVPRPFSKADPILAKEIVQGCYRVKTLEGWLENEGRSDVRALILTQIESLKPKKV